MTLFLTVVSAAAPYKWVECVDVLTNRALFFALQAMAERLAENAHDLWAKRKREELDSIGNSIHLWLRHTDCLSHCLQYIVDQCLQQTCLSHCLQYIVDQWLTHCLSQCLQYIVDQWLTHCHNVSNILWISDSNTLTVYHTISRILRINDSSTLLVNNSNVLLTISLKLWQLIND